MIYIEPNIPNIALQLTIPIYVGCYYNFLLIYTIYVAAAAMVIIYPIPLVYPAII